MKKYFLPLLFTTITLALVFPVGRHLKPILPVLLATLLFFNFYHMKFERQHFFQRETLVYLFIVLVIAPYLVFSATKALSAPLRLGIFLTAITPSAISVTIVVGLIGGKQELSVANIVIANLLSPLSYTVLMKLYFQTDELHVPVGAIVMKLFLMVVVPFVVSLALKKSQRLTQPIQTIAAYANLFFLLMIFTAISSSAVKLRTLPRRELFLVIAVIVLIAGSFYLLGFLLGRGLESKKALIVNAGQKNNSLCIWLALSNFGPLAAIPPTVYIIVQHLINSLLIFIFSRQRS